MKISLGAKILSIVVVVVLSGAGCTKTTKYGNTVIEEKNGATTYTDTKTGAKIEVNTLKLPDNFPKDAPVLSDATIKTSYAIEGNISVGYETGKSPAEAWDWYQKEMAKNGWELTYQQAADDGYISSWEKGDSNSLITIAKDGEKTGVGLMISKNK